MKEVQDGKKTLKQAVDDYDEDVRARGVQEVEVSTVQTHMTHVCFLILSIWIHADR